MQHSSSSVTPAALTTRSADASSSASDGVGGITSTPGTGVAEIAVTVAGAPVASTASTAAATAVGAAPPPITTTTLGGVEPPPREALAARISALSGAYFG